MDNFIDTFGVVGILLLIGVLVLMIFVFIAILTIPKIARYQKAQAKVLALMAKQQGIETKLLSTILYQERLLGNQDSDYAAELFKKPAAEGAQKATQPALSL